MDLLVFFHLTTAVVTRCLLIILPALALAGPAVAQPRWVTVSTQASPGGRFDHAMAYDSDRHRVVLFGGRSLAGVLGDTWEYDGVDWTQFSPTSSPSPRRRHAMAYDSRRKKTVLVGGHNRLGDTVDAYMFSESSTSYQISNETWEWDGTTWTKGPTFFAPIFAQSMTYDAGRGVTVLYGGTRDGNASNGALFYVWEYDGVSWVHRQVGEGYPQLRVAASMVFDPVRNLSTLFGGYGPSIEGDHKELSDTWTWDGNAWSQVAVATPPGALFDQAIAWDTVRNKAILQGGATIQVFRPPAGGTYYSYMSNAGTWEWDGQNWAAIGMATPSPARSQHAMAFDSARGKVVMFGGLLNTTFVPGDTWELEAGLAADAGESRTVNLGTPVRLDGAGFGLDPSLMTYTWTRAGGTGPSVPLSGASTATASFTPAGSGTYIFQLNVTDGRGGSASDTVTITVNTPPAASAGSDEIVIKGTPVRLQATASDADGDPLTYRWAVIGNSGGGVLSSLDTALTTFTPNTAESFLVRLTVTDGRGGQATSDVRIAGNTRPIADAGADQVVPPYAEVLLDGRSSFDPDGEAIRYSWSQTNGEHVELSGTSGARPSFTALVSGTLEFQLAVDDSRGGSASDRVRFTIDRAPVAGATAPPGPFNPGELVTLTGTATDPDGGTLALSWTLDPAAPAPAALAGVYGSAPTFTPPRPGDYRLLLTVSDEIGLTSTAAVSVHVNAPPSVSAGANVDLGPATPIEFVASGSDPDGDALTYSWTIVSSPVPFVLAGASTARASFTPVTEGTYRLRVTASDGHAGSASSEVEAGVAATIANRRPTAQTGPALTALIGEAVALAGRGSDPEGQPLGYSWRQVSGPVAVSLDSAATATATFTAQDAGLFAFELTVDDRQSVNARATATQTVQVSRANRAPAVVGSGPQGTVATGSVVVLSATGTDPDGDQVAYRWAQLAGPLARISSQVTARTTAVLAAAGTYLFRVLATDGRGGSSSAQVSIQAGAVAGSGLALTWTPQLANGGLVPATVGQEYSVTFTAVGGTPPYFYDFLPGSEAPPGLTTELFRKSGVLHGIPTLARGDGFSFVLQATDQQLLQSAPVRLRLVVNSSRLPESPHYPYPTSARLTYEYTSVASPLPVALDLVFDPLTEFETGADFLLVTDSQGRAVSGSPFTGTQLAGRTLRVPGAGARFSLVTDASDPPGRSFYGFAVRELRELQVSPADMQILSTGLPAGRVGTAYAFQLAGTGGLPPYEWRIINPEALPRGLALSPTGLLSGLPSTVVSATVDVLLRDSASPRHSSIQTLPLVVKSSTGPRLSRQVGVPSGGTLPVQVQLTGVTGQAPVRELLAVMAFDPQVLQPGTILQGPVASRTLPFHGLVGQGARSYLFLGDMTQDGLVLTENFRTGDLPISSDPLVRDRLAYLTLVRLQSSNGETFFALPPTADAGLPQAVLLDARGGVQAPDPTRAPGAAGRLRPWVSLDGRRSVDPLGRAVHYSWRQEAGAPVALSAAASPVATFVPPATGSYEFSLTVLNTDGALSVPARVTVAAESQASHLPGALPRIRNVSAAGVPKDARGGPIEAQVGDTLELDGRGSSDPDLEDRDRLTYLWRPSSPSLALSPGNSSARALVSPAQPGTYDFELTVTDPGGLRSEPAIVSAVVRARDSGRLRLVVSASSVIDGTQGAALAPGLQTQALRSLPASPFTTVALKAEAGSLPAGASVRYEWQSVAGPQPELPGSRTASPQMRATTTGVHELECLARLLDASGNETGVTSSAHIRVQVATPLTPIPAAAPRAVAGAPGKRVPAGAAQEEELAVEAGSLVTLDGSGSTDPASTPLAFDWQQVAGPRALLSDPAAAVCTFEAPDERDGQEQVLLFHLTVDNGWLRSEPQPVSVRVTPPASAPFTLDLQRGLNLVALPVEPLLAARLARASDLLGAAGSTFLARTEAGAAGRACFAGAARTAAEEERGFALEAGRGYALFGVPTARQVQLPGRLWARGPANRRLRLTPGLNLVGYPGTPPAGFDAAALRRLTGASFVARKRVADTGFEVHLPENAGFPIERGKAYLLSVPEARAVSLP
jgi:hypothetical protein